MTQAVCAQSTWSFAERERVRKCVCCKCIRCAMLCIRTHTNKENIVVVLPDYTHTVTTTAVIATTFWQQQIQKADGSHFGNGFNASEEKKMLNLFNSLRILIENCLSIDFLS